MKALNLPCAPEGYRYDTSQNPPELVKILDDKPSELKSK
jgi:hypothetical protein